MAVDERQMNVALGAPIANVRRYSGTITVGGAGAVSAQTGTRVAGATFVKNAAAGRYDMTAHRAFKRFIGGGASVMQNTAGGVPNIADGVSVEWTGVTAAMCTDPPTATFPATGISLQCARTDTQAAANPASGQIISWWFEVSDS
jgi:hypothetical protein